MVEFAFAMPVFAIIMVGMIELGQAIHRQQTLIDGTRAAVRYLSRLQNPCTATELQRAYGLVFTRSMDWSKGPLFNGWPGTYAYATSASDFQLDLPACQGGTLVGEVITMQVTHFYDDPKGYMYWIGLGGGISIAGSHEEVHIGS